MCNIMIKMSRGAAFSTVFYVLQVKTQISLRIRAVWSESSQGTLWVAMDLKRLQADAQADLSFRWAHMQPCRKCCAPAQMSLYLCNSRFVKWMNLASYRFWRQ